MNGNHLNIGLFVDSEKYACCIISMPAYNKYELLEERFDKPLAFENMKKDLDYLVSKYPCPIGINVNKLLDIDKLNLENWFWKLTEITFNLEEGRATIASLINDKNLKLPDDTKNFLRFMNPKEVNHRENAIILALTDFEKKIYPILDL